MSGAVAAATCGISKASIAVTVASLQDGSGNTYGFADVNYGGNGGSASPTSVIGATIRCACGLSGNYGAGVGQYFRFGISGARARTFIQGITVQKTDGSYLWLPQSSATQFDSGGFGTSTTWIWFVEPWTNTGTRNLQVSY